MQGCGSGIKKLNFLSTEGHLIQEVFERFRKLKNEIMSLTGKSSQSFINQLKPLGKPLLQTYRWSQIGNKSLFGLGGP
jgi:hypothetical protein